MLVSHPLNQDEAVLLFHIAGVGSVDNLAGSLVDEANRDVIHFGSIKDMVHAAVHIA